MINNKGFAVSTILYGILSLTILILMLIFGIMKSTKDMNGGLVESVTETMDSCAQIESQLESCYFLSSDDCTILKTLYQTCISTKTSIFKLSKVGEVGDFVKYDAGTWGDRDEEETVNKDDIEILKFGGYTTGESKNLTLDTSLDESYNGWRIFYIKDDVVYLIHAGVAEYFNVDFVTSENLIYNYQAITHQEITGTLDHDHNFEPRNWEDTYLNSEYASRVYMLDEEMLEEWKSITSLGYTDGNLINIGTSYLLFDIVDEDQKYYTKYISSDGEILTTNDGLYGIRPIVELNSEVLTKGFKLNEYGDKEWTLFKDV